MCDTGLAAVGTDKGLILVWNLQTGEVVHRLGGSHAAAAAAKQNARKSAVTKSGSTAGVASGHVVRVSDLSFSSDGASLFSVSEDRTIAQWNMTTGALTQYVCTIAHMYSAGVWY